MNKIYILPTLLLSGMVNASSSAESSISLDTRAGYDSNPYRLNEQFPIEESSYFSYGVGVKHYAKKDIRVKVSLDKEVYSSDAEHGDNQTIAAQLRYQTGKKNKPRGIKLSYKQFDKTYVSRLQGSTDTFSGISLNDRYDYEQMGVSMYRTFKPRKRVYNDVELKVINKDYADFNSINVTDYDYVSLILNNQLNHKIAKKHYQNLNFSYESRRFNDREEKDINGDEVLGTDMVFDYFSLSYGQQYDRIKNIKLGLELSYKKRSDSGAGYYDSEWFGIEMNSEFKVIKGSKLKLAYHYKDFSFDREPTLGTNGLDDEFGSDQKHIYSIRTKTRLPKWLAHRSYWIMEYEYLNADSNYEKYKYDRQKFQAGLRLVF